MPGQALSRGRDGVIGAVIASLGGAREETGPRADPQGRYIYLGNENPKTVALWGGRGRGHGLVCSEACHRHGPHAAH